MKAKKDSVIIHHATIKKIIESSFGNDSTKPLINEIRRTVKNRIAFEDLMMLVYDHPKWRWN